MSWRIRPGRPDDLPFLRVMLHQAAAWDPTRPSRSIEAVLFDPTVARYVAGWGREGDVAAIAVDAAGQSLGAAWYRRFSAVEPGYGFVDPAVPELTIGVLPDHRGQGVGWALLWALLFEAAGSGAPALSLSVAVANPAARLYRKVGFVPVAEAGGAWTMRRDLARLPQLQMAWPVDRLAAPPAAVPSGYMLRPLRPGDEPRLYQLMELAGWPGWDADRLARWTGRVAPDGWCVAVEQRSGTIVASAMGLLDRDDDGVPSGELGWVAGDPAHAGRGLGAAVAASVTAQLVALGCRRIHLRSEDFRLAALRTYLKMGYVPVLRPPEAAERWREICRRLAWPFTPDRWY